MNPISVRGTDVPGYATHDDIGTHSAVVSDNHIFSTSLINSVRGSYLRYTFFFDERFNQTPPSALGFGYTSSNAEGQGPPFFNISGLRSFSTLYALTWTAYACAGAIGPVLMGRVFDATGSYERLLVALAVTLAAVASLMLAVPRDKAMRYYAA